MSSLSATSDPTLPTERAAVIRTRLGRLHVRSVGDGPIAILWPSMFVDSHTWDPMVPLLPAGRRYVLVDPPGLGRSEPLHRPSDITGAAEAAMDLLQGLGVDGPVDWLGNAFGGHVGFKLAARPGVLRTLVAISSPAEAIPADLRWQINMLLPILRVAGPAGVVRNAILAGMVTDASAAQEAIRTVVVDSLNRPSRRSLANAVRSFIVARLDVTAELPDICVPSLFVASDDRGDWSPEDAVAAAAKTPGADVIVVRGARTLIPLEQPEVLAGHVRAWWDRIA